MATCVLMSAGRALRNVLAMAAALALLSLLGWPVPARPAEPEARLAPPRTGLRRAADDAASREAALSPRSGAAWAMPRFVYRAEGKRVADVLQDFAASQGLPAVLAEGIAGTVQGDFDAAPEKFLDAISKTFGLLWYHDGSALYFYPAQAIQSRLFRLKGFQRAQVSELLESLRLGDRRYPLRYDANAQTLLVYGPPRHVELVAAAVEQLDAGYAARNRRSVRVVPLSFASAGDRMMGTTRVPGLAATLNELFSAGGAAKALDEAASSPTPAVSPDKSRAMQGVFGGDRSLSELLSRRNADAPGPKAAAAPSPQRAADLADDIAPLFRAEEGTNSILVFAPPQRMAEYVELIRRLDLRPVLVELEATIIDVNSDSVETLGVTWSAQNARGKVSLTPPTVDVAAALFRIGTVWSDAGRALLASIDALSAAGKANVVARPKLLGVANRPAVMKERRVIVVRVAGNLEANLFQLEAGTLLQMTPFVTTVNGETRIRLSLYIEDGGFEEATVDGVPSLKRMEISTEAHVLEGESVLIGGITTTTDQSSRSGVPGLSKLPFLGGLFRTQTDKNVRSERLFLITPRVIRDAARLPESAVQSN